MNGVSMTWAALNLFNVNDGAEKLDEEKAHLCHHLVAKLLYLSCRSRQDIQTVVAFVCTRVQKPNETIGDFFTKSLQHAQFTRMHAKILNLPSSTCTAVHRSVLKKEKVKTSDKAKKVEKRKQDGPKTRIRVVAEERNLSEEQMGSGVGLLFGTNSGLNGKIKVIEMKK